jgi:hypothetical protein
VAFAFSILRLVAKFGDFAIFERAMAIKSLSPKIPILRW